MDAAFTACGKSKATVIPSAARDLLFSDTLRIEQTPRTKFAFAVTIDAFFRSLFQPLKYRFCPSLTGPEETAA
jgi:hypothetical protein